MVFQNIDLPMGKITVLTNKRAVKSMTPLHFFRAAAAAQPLEGARVEAKAQVAAPAAAAKAKANANAEGAAPTKKPRVR